MFKRSINNIDINLITENPKVSKIRLKILRNLSKICHIPLSKINLKGARKGEATSTAIMVDPLGKISVSGNASKL